MHIKREYQCHLELQPIYYLLFLVYVFPRSFLQCMPYVIRSFLGHFSIYSLWLFQTWLQMNWLSWQTKQLHAKEAMDMTIKFVRLHIFQGLFPGRDCHALCGCQSPDRKQSTFILTTGLGFLSGFSETHWNILFARRGHWMCRTISKQSKRMLECANSNLEKQ